MQKKVGDFEREGEILMFGKRWRLWKIPRITMCVGLKAVYENQKNTDYKFIFDHLNSKYSM